MITALLTAAALWCMLYSRLQIEVLVPLCAGLGLFLAFFGRHKHTQFLTIDVFAQTSRFYKINPALKFLTALALMFICVASRSPVLGLVLALSMLVITVYAGKLRLRDYIRLLTLPVSFLMLSGLALLFSVYTEPSGVLNIPAFGYWLSVTQTAQTRAMLVMSRSFGAVSCLYFLSLTTPMSDIISVLRRVKCPNVIIDLSYLIYRYIFVLLSMYHTMRSAAKSRMGFSDYRASVRSTGNIYSNLLVRSYKQANLNFDAMESRCFDGDIRFLEKSKKIMPVHIIAASGAVILTLSLSLIFEVYI